MNVETHLQEASGRSPASGTSRRCAAVVAIVFSVVILIWTDAGLTALVALFGAFALVSGVSTIAGASASRSSAAAGRGSSSTAC